MALDGLLDPYFELFLALEVDASVKVFIGCLINRAIQVPLHSDEIALRALKLINI